MNYDEMKKTLKGIEGRAKRLLKMIEEYEASNDISKLEYATVHCGLIRTRANFLMHEFRDILGETKDASD